MIIDLWFYKTLGYKSAVGQVHKEEDEEGNQGRGTRDTDETH